MNTATKSTLNGWKCIKFIQMIQQQIKYEQTINKYKYEIIYKMYELS